VTHRVGPACPLTSSSAIMHLHSVIRRKYWSGGSSKAHASLGDRIPYFNSNGVLMKCIRKLAEHFFINENDGISLLILAIAAAASSSGIVVLGLWIAHTPPALPTSNAACLDRCEKVCEGYPR
jgi:hypothetical protein